MATELKQNDNVGDLCDTKEEKESQKRYSLTVAVIQHKLELHLHDTQTKYMYHGSFTSDDLQKCGFGNNQASKLEKVCKFLESARQGHHQLNFEIKIEKNGNSKITDSDTGIIKITKDDEFFPLEIILRLKQTPRKKIDILEEHIQDLKKENASLKSELQELRELKEHAMAKGTIVMWNGTVDSIPKGWSLCNGKHGTPDLRNRFLVGATDKFDINSQGGMDNHNHVINVQGHQLTIAEMPRHTHEHQHSIYHFNGTQNKHHTPSGDWGCQLDKPSITETGGNQAHNHNAESQASNHLPPYYAVCFIMKII
eukprot:399841_1